jgi:hypothetical protein
MRRLQFLAAGMLLTFAGCSGGDIKFAPVSGVITLNGQPYPNAVISFQPIGTEKNPNPGRGSSAYTDANGRYELMCDNEIEGAVVGKHLVRIMTRGNDIVGATDTGSPDDAPPVRPGFVDPIPAEWNSLSNVEFDVPPKGTDKANFDIVNPRYKGPIGR